MCIGNLFSGHKPQQPPPRMAPPPPLQPPPPPPEQVTPEVIKEETEEEKLSNKRRKELEAERIKEGTKTFGSVDSSTMPDTPEGGVAPPV